MVDDASRVWAEDMSTAYDEYLVPAVFRPYAEDLADRIAQQAPRDVLELAAGTGVLTRALLARLPDAHITATDLNVAMVKVGAERAPAATWRQADAMALAFDDASFDLVACQFGVMFLPDRPGGYAGFGRVLRPGGRVLFNSWGPLAEHEVEATVMAALAELYPDDPPTFLARIPHGYCDADLVAADLAAAGFVDVQVERLTLDCAGRTAAELARGYCRGTPLRPEIEARGGVEATIPAVAAALAGRFGPGPITAGMSALVASAAAP